MLQRILLPLGLLAVLLFLPARARAQSQPITLGTSLALELSGGLQSRVSYGVQARPGEADARRLGVGLRRARFQARLVYGGKLGAEYDVDGASGSVQSVDLFGFYRFTDRLEMRLGYMAGAQPRAFIGTPYVFIDAAERAAIAERWGAGTLGGLGRDMGLDLTYAAPETRLELFVHSGDGTFSRAGGNYSESITAPSVVREVDETALAVTGAARFTPSALPGFEVGGFAGVNAAGNSRTELSGTRRGYVTGGAHLYWGAVPGSQPVRLKLDALGIGYEKVGGFRQQAVGVSMLGAARVLRHGEAFARVERFWADTDAHADAYLTAGLSYSLSAAMGRPYHLARLTLAYMGRATAETRAAEDAQLLVIEAQIAF